MIKTQYLKEFETNTSVTQAQFLSLKLPKRLPLDYVEFLMQYDGGEGDVGEEYLVLHKANELLEINEDIEIAQFDKDIFVIGSNGGGEYVAIDFRNDKPLYILIPYIFEYVAIIALGSTMNELLERIYTTGFFE